MRMKTSLFKRSLAALLCFVMVLGMIPAFGMASVALAVEGEEGSEESGTPDGSTGGETGGETQPGQQTNITGNYITLPITIRDYAADGMLFEYNEVNRYNLDDEEGATKYIKTDRIYQAGGAAYSAQYNPDYWDHNSTDGTLTANDGYDFTGLRVYEADYGVYYSGDETTTSGAYWYCVILDSSGNVLEVVDLEANKEEIDAHIKEIGGAYSVWAWRNPKNVPYYSLLAQITNENKHLYRFGFDMTTDVNSYNNNGVASLYLGRSFYQSVATWQHDSKGIYVYGGNGVEGWLGSLDSYDAWHCLIVRNSDNQVVEVIPNGTDKVAESAQYLTADYKFVMAWSDGSNRDYYDYIAGITDENRSEYQIVIQNTGKGGPCLFVERTIYVNEADTRGFGLLFTDGEDYLNWIGDDTSDAQNLPGSKYVSNNTGSSIEVNLWDKDGTVYAKQDVYGAGIRTNLVGKELDPVTGKPVYTESTITFLAKYMQEVMQVPLYNETDNAYGAAGTYNSYHVMGTKLFVVNPNYVANPGPEINPLDNFYFNYVGPAPEATHDLAAVFRHSVGNAGNNLGSYADSKEKFDGRLLIYPQQATTWFDAAYYLLNMLWNDSPIDNRTGTAGQDGYGMPISNYNRIHLVQTTNAEGQICYVFNAKYDGTTYDYNNGEIFNSHFPEGTNAETRTYSPAYTRAGATENIYGNILPAARFDPIGPGGSGVNRGYTMSGNTYGDFAQNDTMNWAEYYQETNYNLTLEGHAEFVYHQDANQYFIFTGDDDVYLYINGIRVLDVGGAHSIAKVGIDINDVAETCGLKDGGTYRFDFFYTERHGTAANFGIETNIQIADTSMVTTKTGYQNGMPTGYNGFVDPAKPVAYSFSLKNNGLAPIYNLTFDDPAIDTHFSWNEDDIKLNSDTNINDMYLYRFNANGTVKSSIQAGKLTTADISRELKAGLPVGETIAIYGFKYNITNAQKWTADGNFLNTVTTSATKTTATDQDATLHGVADWMVQRAELSFTPFHVYDAVHKDVKDTEWTSATVNLTKRELLQYFVDANKISADEADTIASNEAVTVLRCTASGDHENEYYQNPCVTVNADGSITYASAKPGVDTVFYKIVGINNGIYDNLVLNYDVFTYGAANNVYVLDYGLAVELNCDQYGFQVNDQLEVPQNTYKPSTTIRIQPAENMKYGTFVYNEDKEDKDKPILNPLDTSVKYVPNKIIDGADVLNAFITIREDNENTDKTKDLKYWGVDLQETVSTVPANVVYYEENFPGITYVEEDGNKWTHYETMDGGQSQAGTTQSSNQDTNYGFDSNYENDKTGTLTQQGNVGTVVTNGSAGTVIDTTSFKINSDDLQEVQNKGIALLNEYLGLGGSDSNGSVNRLTVCATDREVMYFEFVGTGCEIISRTTADQYAVISVQVQKYNEDGTYTIIREKPVITESKGGTLYQVPIISLKGMEKAKYRVLVYADGSTEETTRVLYIDGIRIYGPLSDEEALTYYNPEEARAEFLEVKKLIQKGQAIYADTAGTGENNKLVTGKIMVEDVDKAGVLTKITNVNQYLTVGPNNELYLSGNDTCSAFIFWLKPKEFLDENKTIPYPENARTLEIGAHRKSNALVEPIKGPAHLNYGSQPSDITGGVNQYSVNSATEMYYAIDVNKLLKDPEKGYLVMIGTNGSDLNVDTLALTNIKVAGYDISFVEEEISAYSENGGNVLDEETVRRIFELLNEQMATLKQEAEAEQIPINENLSIRIAKMMSDTVSSGKYATLTVRAGIDADKLVVKDSEGNVVQAFYNIRTVAGGEAVFTFLWQINGSSGTAQMYTVRVYDAAGNASVNAETVTVIVN